ncbi:MAG: hypothetical protein ACKO43_01905, partial [Alphaproteobacteria bacterium]
KNVPMIMASPQNSLKLTQTNPYPIQNQNLDRVFRGALDFDDTSIPPRIMQFLMQSPCPLSYFQFPNPTEVGNPF